MQEAIVAVGKMLNAYPNARDGVRDGYMGTIAALLCKYPRRIAEQCANPINGVCRETKFLPTVHDVVVWCEKHQGTMSRIVEHERRSQTQFREREEYERQDKTEPPEYRKAVAERIMGELRTKGFQFKGDTKPQQQTWKQFSADELLAKYPPREGT
jgi:hypothetical protein